MKNPFNFFLRRNKNYNNEANKDLSEEDVILDEKGRLLSNLNASDLDSIFFRSGLNRDTISLEFVQKLSESPSLLSYLANNIFEADIILKINDNSLRVSDVKEYKKELFDYDIFANEDRDVLDILRSDINISDKGYASFSLEEFEKGINGDNYIESYATSLIGIDRLIAERRKAIPLSRDSFYRYGTNIIVPLDNNEVFSQNIFDWYYSGELNFSKDVILFITYDEFLEWIKDDEKMKILDSVQVVIRDDYSKVNNVMYNINDFGTGSSYKYEDNLIVQVNHLLHVLNKSDLDDRIKAYYRYYISKYFNLIKNNKFDVYSYINSLKELALKLEKELDEKVVSQSTIEFNELEMDLKRKEVKTTKFSANVFLCQFDDLDMLTSFELLGFISALNNEERRMVFENKIVINKLKGLLKESSTDQYRGYDKFCSQLSVDEIFKVFDHDFIADFFKNNRDQVQYRFFFKIMEIDINKTLEYLLEDDSYFKEFAKDLDRYYFNGVDYLLVIKLLKKIEENNLELNFINNLDVVCQFKLLKEEFSNDFLVKIVKSASKEVQQFFYLEDKRFNYLWDKFDIVGLSRSNYKFNDDVASKNEFFDRFKGTSMINFRANVNQFLNHQADFFFEEKIIKYEDELISYFDKTSGLFVQYQYLIDNISLLDDRKFINGGIDFFYDSITNFECRQLKCVGYDEDDKLFVKDKDKLVNYLKWLSKMKLNEVIVDRLFQDNIYNVFLNIREMLRYNKGLSNEEKVLDDERLEFYNTILNIDKLEADVILEVYNKFKDKNVALMFYEDLRKTKDKAYDDIKKDMFQPENSQVKEDEELSNKYGIPVFDLREKSYVMLTRCLSSKHKKLNYNRRDCYTILSNDNSKVFYDSDYIYGYSGFDNDCVLHMFEGDAFSGDVKNNNLSTGSDRVNRIMSGRELANASDWYSEVQIVNKKSVERREMFETLKPSFLIVYDEIDEKNLEEAKRKNIPICIISHTLNKEVVKDFSAFDVSEELRYTPEWGIGSEDVRRKNR